MENNNVGDMFRIMSDIKMTTCVNGSQALTLYGFAWYKMFCNKTAYYLDVGTRGGNSAIILASALKHHKTDERGILSKVYTVDDYSQFLDKTKEEDIEAAKYNISQFGIDDHVGNDIEFVNSLPDNSIDMVFDDSFHSYYATGDRLNSYLPKLNDNSLVVVHDYYINHPGVIKAVLDFTNDHKDIIFGLNYQDGMGWFFCKPNTSKYAFNFQRKPGEVFGF